MVDSAAPVILDFQLPRSRPGAGERARSPADACTGSASCLMPVTTILLS
jgi:hypothetical protein